MMLNKKGLSQVVGTLLMILLTIAAVAAVWGVIDTFVNTKLEDTSACYDVYDRVELNNRYTCYNVTSNQTYISVNIKEIEIDSLLVSVQYNGTATPFELTNDPKTIPNVFYYQDTPGAVELPGSNAGKTYVLDIIGMPKKISIAPKVSGKQCDASSVLNSIPTCF